MLGDPSCDTLSDLHPHMIYQISVRIFRCTHDQVFALKDINEARITRDHARYETNDSIENKMERIGSSDATTDFMKKIDLCQTITKSCHGRCRFGDAPHWLGSSLFGLLFDVVNI